MLYKLSLTRRQSQAAAQCPVAHRHTSSLAVGVGTGRSEREQSRGTEGHKIYHINVRTMTTGKTANKAYLGLVASQATSALPPILGINTDQCLVILHKKEQYPSSKLGIKKEAHFKT